MHGWKDEPMTNEHPDTNDPIIVFMYAGLPGAGKSTVANLAADLMGGSVVETGDLVRRHARQELGDSADSQAIGEWAAAGRESQGTAFITEKLVGELLRGELDVEYPLHVVGVRHVDEVLELRNFASTSFVVYVEADFDRRLQRLQERGRDGEDRFNESDLLDRDQRELNELGTATILGSDQVELTVENNYNDITPLHEEVQRMVNDYIAYSGHGQ